MANQIDLIVSKNAEKQLKDLLTNLEKVHSEIVDISGRAINFNMGRSPRDLQAMNDAMRESVNLMNQLNGQANATQNLTAQINNLNRARQQSSQRTAEETVNQQALNRNAIEHARINSTLVGAYQRLSAEQSRASRTVQDLIARGRTATQTQREYDRELRNAQREFDGLNRRVTQADRAVGRFNRNVGNYPSQAISGIRDLMGAFGVVGGLALAAGVAKDIFNTTKELQSLDLALKQVTETDAKFAESQAFLRDISERYGVEINGLTKQFTQFYVSAKDKISGKEIQGIFESVAKSAGFMGLSVEAQDRAFVALNQMMSKGTVSAEELKGQLGEALPGAFGIMAKALGTTEVGLAKLMKDGKVLAADVLPKFAKELEKAYGIENKDRVESLAASTSRLSNSWTNFVRELNEGSGVISAFLSNMTDEISKTIDAWIKLLALSGTTKEIFDKKTAEGYNSQLKSLQEQADKYGVTLVEQAKSTQKLAIVQRDQAKAERDYLIQRKNSYNEATEIARSAIGLPNRIAITNDLIRESTKQYGYWNGVIKATNQVIKTGKTTIDDDSFSKGKNTEETAKNTKAKKDNYDILARIYELEKMRIESQKVILEKEFDDENKYFDDRVKLAKDYSEESLKLANLTLNENLRLAKGKYIEEQIAYEKYYAELANITEDEEKKILDIRKKANEEFRTYLEKYGRITDEELFGLDVRKMPTEKIDELVNKWKDYKENVDSASDSTKKLKDETNDWLQGFIDQFASDTGFVTFFQVLQDKIKGFGDDWKTTMVGIMEVTQEAMSFINQTEEAQYNDSINRLSSQKDIAIQFAGESTTARAEIERQYEERRKQLDRQRAEHQKKLAIFNAVINTAQAVVEALPNPPLAIAIGIIGAAQIAMIAAQPIPAYAEGTDNHSGGLMLINDGKGSNYTETVETPDGKLKQYKGRNVLVNAPKGTKVHTHEQWQDKLNSILADSGIKRNYAYETQQQDNSDITNEIKALSRIIQNKESITITRDEKGERIYKKVQGQRQQMLNARLNIKGYDI